MAKGAIIKQIGDDDYTPAGGLRPLLERLEQTPELDVLIGQNTVMMEDNIAEGSRHDEHQPGPAR